MHLSEKVICQPAVVVKARQVSTANIADLQLLVTGWARSILKVLEIALETFLLVLGGANFVHFTEGECHRACFAENRDFLETGVDGVGKIGNLFELFNKSAGPFGGPPLGDRR